MAAPGPLEPRPEHPFLPSEAAHHRRLQGLWPWPHQGGAGLALACASVLWVKALACLRLEQGATRIPQAASKKEEPSRVLCVHLLRAPMLGVSWRLPPRPRGLPSHPAGETGALRVK